MMNILHKILKSFNKNNNTSELHLTSTFSTYNQRNDCYKILLQQKETETLVTEVNIKIDKINELVLIANKTIDRKEFYNTIEEISKIFTELLDYEYKLDFPYSPSALLKDFENKQENWIKLLEQRINIKENREAKTKSVTINNLRISSMKQAVTSQALYHDEFNKEYREIDNYKKIKFTGKNQLAIPQVQICAAILLSANQNGSKIKNNDNYSLYFEGRYGIVNISRLHQWLYEQGYLRSAVLREALSLYKVPELKILLERLGLKKSGNKEILIDRIIEGINDDEKEKIVSECEHLFLTDKGCEFLRENEDYVMYHRKSYGVTFEEFNKHRILQGRKRRFYDTIFNVLSQKAAEYQFKGYFSRLEMIYFNLSDVLYDEGRYDLALQNILFRMYFSTNLASHTYYFNIDHVKYNGIKKIREHIIACNDVFYKTDLNRIVELKEYYSENLLDIVYSSHILPYTIFDKTDLAGVIRDLLNEVYFDAEHYMNYIYTKYEKYIQKFM